MCTFSDSPRNVTIVVDYYVYGGSWFGRSFLAACPRVINLTALQTAAVSFPCVNDYRALVTVQTVLQTATLKTVACSSGADAGVIRYKVAGLRATRVIYTFTRIARSYQSINRRLYHRLQKRHVMMFPHMAFVARDTCKHVCMCLFFAFVPGIIRCDTNWLRIILRLD